VFVSLAAHLHVKCDGDLYVIDHQRSTSMDVSMMLKTAEGRFQSFATEAFEGSPTGRFEVPQRLASASIVFNNDDRTLCQHWRVVGFTITANGLQSYAIRLGHVASKAIQVSVTHI